jgi:hypothetical protein
MNKEKQFDCVKFKNELHENLLKKSGVKNIREYVEYVNKIAKTSDLYRNNQVANKNANVV